MALPFFYIENFPGNQPLFTLTDETSRHVIQVLRMKPGEHIQLTNGKGEVKTVEITSENKKATEVKIISASNISNRTPHIIIAISLIKNTTRFEWFLEKATEIGVSEIIPLICERTEKQHFRLERMRNILVSAMLQSQQAWLPTLHEPIKFSEIIKNTSYQNKFIAHCIEGEKKHLASQSHHQSSIILIGPEGDFAKAEIDLAQANNFIPVSLGETRLRTETAGMVACVLLNTDNIN